MVTDTGVDALEPEAADAIFVIEPLSISAWVIVSLAIQVSVSAGARPALGKAGHATESILSSEMTIGSVNETLPVFVTI